MEFPFNINQLLGDEITLLHGRIKPHNKIRDSYHQYRDQLCKVIDKLGIASAKAQGLHGAITSASKLEFSDHNLYVMKDAEGTDGKGSAVGFIKVGYKKLFVYDSHHNQHEMAPLCVLDFYVHESRQRMGCGKKLFEHMLKAEHIKPQHLAIDRPSHKFQSFLHKHYNMKAEIPQVNNFMVFEGFFRDRPPEPERKRDFHGRPPLHPYSRSRSGKNRGHLYEEQSSHSAPAATTSGRQSSLSNSNVPLTPLEKERDLLKDILVPRSGSREQLAQYGSQPNLTRSNSLTLELDNLSLSATHAMGAQASRYSRYTNDGTPTREERRATPVKNQQQTMLQQGQGHGSVPGLGSLTGLGQGPGPGQSSGARVTPVENAGGSSPPLLKRGGPTGVSGALNTHQDYLSRGGHLKLSPAATAPTQVVSPAAGSETNTSTPPRAAKPLSMATTWNIFGVPQASQSPASAKKWSHTKLW
ncbi:alpha-tubulin N-acetyltransferase 1 [Lingula anatina]|uniref:Alpha-tubulin N-acetyltransferase n=1 Tax=Lingula anatina TaxID=7574 RepID=A0A1S3H3I7_LINAN|nr:alpha-tubulin N-acetyltransferase 1 [Lingula anatina]|eukprot:XP_013380700.1 alpha-tubulin N-acetyltransferase 1 [Lingula anatina]